MMMMMVKMMMVMKMMMMNRDEKADTRLTQRTFLIFVCFENSLEKRKICFWMKKLVFERETRQSHDIIFAAFFFCFCFLLVFFFKMVPYFFFFFDFYVFFFRWCVISRSYSRLEFVAFFSRFLHWFSFCKFMIIALIWLMNICCAMISNSCMRRPWIFSYRRPILCFGFLSQQGPEEKQ